MKQKLSQSVTYWLGVVAIGLIVGLSLQFVRAWTEPAVAPPGGNIGAPINTSDTGQSKAGNLLLNSNGTWANGLIVANGNVGIGTADLQAKLVVMDSQRWHWSGEPSNYYLHLKSTLHGDSDVSFDFIQKNFPTEYNVLTFRKGNVGIGTANPAQKLDVAGDIKSSNKIWSQTADISTRIWAGNEICLGGVCRNSWPTGGGTLSCILATCSTAYFCTATCPAGYTVTGCGYKYTGSRPGTDGMLFFSGNGCEGGPYDSDTVTIIQAQCCKIQ